MFKRIRFSVLAALLTLSHIVYAHGEDELGPHKGYIKMPGAYHVEVITNKDKLDIMLLDVNFKNPTVLNSHMKAKIKNDNEIHILKCETMDNYYSCAIDAALLNSKGVLVIESERQFAEGMPVEYALPLKLEKLQG
jgi:hypothetical protein